MTEHACPRCGHETHCSHGSWHDRHPFAAVLFAVPMGTIILGAIAAYPVVFLSLLGTVAVGYVIHREHERRTALAARADWEHHALIASQVRALPQLPPITKPALRTTRHLVAQLPTTPLWTGR